MGRRELFWAAGVAMGALFASSPAQALYDPKEPPVLYAPVSARSTALGNALYCSETEGVRYNPAYAGMAGCYSFFGTYGVLQRETAFSGFYGQFPAGSFGCGIGISDIRTHFDNYAGAEGESSGRITVSQTLFSLGVGKGFAKDRILLGAAGRLLVDGIDSSSGSGATLDAGLGLNVNPRFRLGVVLGNLYSTFRDNDSLAPVTTVAVSLRPVLSLPLQQDTESNGLFVAAAVYRSDPLRLSAGWESVFGRVVALRAGFNRTYPVLGLGLRVHSVTVDVASELKEQGSMYFFTLGWKFARTPAGSGPAVAAPAPAKEAAASPAPAVVVPQAAPAVQQPAPAAAPAAAPAGSSEAEEMAEQGWTQLRENNPAGALKSFAAALALDPSNESAIRGKGFAEGEIEKEKKRRSAHSSVIQGNRVLARGDYAKAKEFYRQALNDDPGSAEAREGLRRTVESASRELGEHLKSATRLSFDEVRISEGDALALVEKGGFDCLLSALQLMNEGKYLQAWAQWCSVSPADCLVVRQFGPIFALFPERELAARQKKADALARKGQYQSAVREIEGCLADYVTDDTYRKKVKAKASSYETAGRKAAVAGLDKASALIKKKQYRQARAQLEAVLRSGYGTDKAKRMLKTINGKQEPQRRESQKRRQEPPPPAEERAPAEEERPAPQPLPRAPAPAPVQPRSEAKEEKAPGAAQRLDPRIKAGLLQLYEQQVLSLFEQRRYGECRECLKKILFIDPGNEKAKRQLKELEGVMQREGQQP